MFPSDTALLKALYLATFEVTKKWEVSDMVEQVFTLLILVVVYKIIESLSIKK